MVQYSGLDSVYAALSDPTRRLIIERLASEGGLRVTELAAPLPMSLNATSKHIKVLERAGLVNRRIRGRDHHLMLNPERLSAAWSWIGLYRRFWEGRLDALEQFLVEGNLTEPRSRAGRADG